MQSIWEHEMPGDICPCKELAEAAWAAHERRQPSQKESKKRNREGGTGKGVLRGVDEVVSPDEKDENETTGRLGRMQSACEKCTKLCSRSDDDQGEGIACCQCTSREEKCIGIQEWNMCWQRIL